MSGGADLSPIGGPNTTTTPAYTSGSPFGVPARRGYPIPGTNGGISYGGPVAGPNQQVTFSDIPVGVTLQSLGPPGISQNMPTNVVDPQTASARAVMAALQAQLGSQLAGIGQNSDDQIASFNGVTLPLLRQNRIDLSATSQDALNKLAQQQYRNVDLAREQGANSLNDAIARYNNTITSGGKARDLAYKNYVDTAGYNNSLAAWAQNQFAQQSGAANIAYDAAQRQALSSATQRGAVGSRGFGQDQDYNAQVQQNALDAAGNENQHWLDRILNYNQNNEQQYQSANNSLDDSDNNALLSLQQAQNSYGTNNKALDSIAAEYGTTADGIRNALQRGLDRVGLNQADAYSNLVSSLNSNDAQSAAAKQNYIQQLISYGVGPSGTITDPAVQQALAKVTQAATPARPTPVPTRTNVQPRVLTRAAR